MIRALLAEGVAGHVVAKLPECTGKVAVLGYCLGGLSQQKKFPATEVFQHIEIADGRIWLRPDGIEYSAGDLPEQEQQLVWATQGVPATDLFDQKVEGTAWRSKPSWYIVAKNDRTVHPELERFAAKRIGASIHEIDSSHAPMLSKPRYVLDVIRAAATAVQGSAAGVA